MNSYENQFLEIDGSYLEGGGQILRNSLSFSCILRKPIRIVNIRANRPNPGLSNQHLFALNLLQKITNAKVKGNFVRSTVVEFEPQGIGHGSYMVDTKTAASIALVAQAALPVLLFAGGVAELEIRGGSNVDMAPQVDYLTEVVWPNLELFGASFQFELLNRGYYPRGGGRCKFLTFPVKKCIAAKITEFGTLHSINGWCFVAGKLPARLAAHMKSEIISRLRTLNCRELFIEDYKESPNMAIDNGSGVIIKATTDTGCIIGSSALCVRTVDPASMANTVTNELRQYIHNKNCTDSHVQDQLIIFMALADGISKVKTCEITSHTKTAIHVAEIMTGVKFKISPCNNGNLIECEGHCIINKNKLK